MKKASVTCFEKFPSDGKHNFVVAKVAVAIDFVLTEYYEGSFLDDLDRESLTFADWCFNLLKSNTESLVHLNVETIGGAESIGHSLIRFVKST